MDITKDNLKSLTEICEQHKLKVEGSDIVWSSAFIRLNERTIELEILNKISNTSKELGFRLYGVISNRDNLDRLDLHFSNLENE